MLLAVRTSPKSILCRVDTPVARFQPVTSTTTSSCRNQPNIREVLLQRGGTSCVDSTHSLTSRQLAAPPAVPCSICLSGHRPAGCNESLTCVDSTHTGRTGPPEKHRGLTIITRVSSAALTLGESAWISHRVSSRHNITWPAELSFRLRSPSDQQEAHDSLCCVDSTHVQEPCACQLRRPLQLSMGLHFARLAIGDSVSTRHTKTGQPPITSFLPTKTRTPSPAKNLHAAHRPVHSSRCVESTQIPRSQPTQQFPPATPVSTRHSYPLPCQQ